MGVIITVSEPDLQVLAAFGTLAHVGIGRHGIPPEAFGKGNGSVERLGISLRDFKGVRGGVGRRYGRPREFQRQGGGNAAASGAEVDDPGFGRRHKERLLDQDFGVGAGNEHRVRHMEVAPVELLASGEVGDRGAGGAHGNEEVEAHDLLFGNFLFVVRDQILARAPRHEAEQNHRFKASDHRARLGELSPDGRSDLRFLCHSLVSFPF